MAKNIPIIIANKVRIITSPVNCEAIPGLLAPRALLSPISARRLLILYHNTPNNPKATLIHKNPLIDSNAIIGTHVCRLFLRSIACKSCITKLELLVIPSTLLLTSSSNVLGVEKKSGLLLFFENPIVAIIIYYSYDLLVSSKRNDRIYHRDLRKIFIHEELINNHGFICRV